MKQLKIFLVFEQKKEKCYYKLITVGSFLNSNYIEYESSSDWNKTWTHNLV